MIDLTSAKEILQSPDGVKNQDGDYISIIDLWTDILDQLRDEGSLSIEDINRLSHLISDKSEKESVGDISDIDTGVFNRLINEVFEYGEHHRKKVIPEKLKFVARKIVSSSNPQRALLLFFAGKSGLEEYREDIARIMKVYMAFHHLEKNSIFEDVETKEAAFQSEFLKCFDNYIETEKRDDEGLKKYSAEFKVEGILITCEICLKTKSKWRAVDKLIRKPGATFQNMSDLFGARVIVKNQKDRKAFADKFEETNFFKKYHLSLERESFSNVQKDQSRSEIKFESEEWDDSQGDNQNKIRVEIQIMTKAAYQRSETGAKNHQFYAEILQSFFRDDRIDGGVDSSQVEERINDLVEKISLRRGQTKAQLKNELYERLKEYFFKWDGRYYSYENVFRKRHKELSKFSNELLSAAILKLNKRGGYNFSEKKWKQLLNTPTKISADGKVEVRKLDELCKSVAGLPAPVVAYIKSLVKKTISQS